MHLPPPSSVRRLLPIVVAVGLLLPSLGLFVWAAPTDTALHNDALAFASTTSPTPSTSSGTSPLTLTPSPSSGTPTSSLTPAPTATIRVNVTPGFVSQPSMAGDAGSSMGADAPGSGSTPAATGGANPMGMDVPGLVATPAAAPIGGSGTACMPLTTGNAFAAGGFQAQWQAGEALTANFWGPAGTGGLPEPYADASGGQRTVQYFDKGRMELTAPNTVTNGLLATEMITGQLQIGNAAFQAKPAPSIPIAGDPDNAGPTYASLGTTAMRVLAPTAMASGQGVTTYVAADGTVSTGPAGSDPVMVLSSYDAATQHNVAQAFAQYRDKVSLAAVGLAKSEPFLATVKVGGVPKQVMIQVFERRVLTYTASNDPALRVEMGNIGQHYYRWRYCS